MYTLKIEPSARADLQRLDATIRARVRTKLERLRETCDSQPHKRLKGKHSDKFSLTVARHYRILYAFDRRTREIVVHRVGHRRNVY